MPKVKASVTPEGYFFECDGKRTGPFSLKDHDEVNFYQKVASELNTEPKEVLKAKLRLDINRHGKKLKTSQQDDHPRCRDCLLFKTPRCLYDHVSALILEDDAACCHYYPLEKRLVLLRRRVYSNRMFERAVENL